MKKINAGKYEVAAAEEITVVVTPENVGPFVAVALGGIVLKPVPGTENTKPTYTFKVDISSIAKMQFSFPNAPSTAKYDVVITGSGGGDTGGFTILQTASIKDPNVRFIVV